MKPSPFLAAVLLMAAMAVASTPSTRADGCATSKTDSNGRTCQLQSENVTTCLYYNDSTHCTGGSDDYLELQ